MSHGIYFHNGHISPVTAFFATLLKKENNNNKRKIYLH